MATTAGSGGSGGGRTVRARIGREAYRTEITTGPNDWLADEPVEAGGEGWGPDPYALLLSALGACKAITMRMYADRKAWPLEAATVRLSHGRVHVDDCADCESNGGKVDEIRVELELEGELTEEQRARLAEIADRCPVHRTLTSETRIRSRLRPVNGTAASD